MVLAYQPASGTGRGVCGRAVCTCVVRFVVVIAVAVMAERSVLAEPTTQPTTAPSDVHLISRWFSELASSDAAVRDAARAHLMRLDRADLPILQQLVRRSRPLTPAQAAALRPVVEEIFLAGEPYKKEPTQGFLGIIMDQSGLGARDLQQPNDDAQGHRNNGVGGASVASGVVIADRFPGFCASRSLHDGDVILGTAEPAQAFNSPDDLKFAIGSLQPGAVVRLQVLRHGQVVEVPLRLDCKPAEVDSLEAAESFRRERAEKFEQYWHGTFAPLLKESVG